MPGAADETDAEPNPVKYLSAILVASDLPAPLSPPINRLCDLAFKNRSR
jgi:hypothetical protein